MERLTDWENLLLPIQIRIHLRLVQVAVSSRQACEVPSTFIVLVRITITKLSQVVDVWINFFSNHGFNWGSFVILEVVRGKRDMCEITCFGTQVFMQKLQCCSRLIPTYLVEAGNSDQDTIATSGLGTYSPVPQPLVQRALFSTNYCISASPQSAFIVTRRNSEE